ncbi:MAG: cadherin-like beta sandwich domain-containing protein [Saccharofermentanales bacterium]
MKKILAVIAIIQMVLILGASSVSAAAPSTAITGPATVRAGDTINIAISMNGTGLSAVQGEIRYDPALLVYKSNAGILNGWTIEIGGSTAGKVTFLGIDDGLSAPINSSRQLFILTFQVKSTVSAGTGVKITTANLTATDGNNDLTPANATYSVNIAAPLSSNAMLSKLTVSNATISPAFKKSTTAYTASVPFSVSKLSIAATSENNKAKVIISGNALAAGGTTDVAITVTAENGAKKVYSIKVTREADPNYKASTNADIAGITVEGFLLSPAFDPGITSYVIWLPTETTEVKVTGRAEDAKATVEVLGGDALIEGWDNPVKVVCTAESGNRKEYTVIARRASSSGGTSGSLSSSQASTGTESSGAISRPSSSSSNSREDTAVITQTTGVPGWAVILFIIASIGIGFCAGVLVNSRSYRY